MGEEELIGEIPEEESAQTTETTSAKWEEQFFSQLQGPYAQADPDTESDEEPCPTKEEALASLDVLKAFIRQKTPSALTLLMNTEFQMTIELQKERIKGSRQTRIDDFMQ